MPLEFSAQSKQRVERLLSRYPTKQAALLPVLHVAQDEFGHLPDEALELVSRTLELAPAHVFGVVTFYTMFHREKHGRNELMVCTNISCMLTRRLRHPQAHREAARASRPARPPPTARSRIVEEECLAACANAPMMICGDQYFLDLTPEEGRRRCSTSCASGGREQQTEPRRRRCDRTMLGVGPGPEQKV